MGINRIRSSSKHVVLYTFIVLFSFLVTSFSYNRLKKTIMQEFRRSQNHICNAIKNDILEELDKQATTLFNLASCSETGEILRQSMAELINVDSRNNLANQIGSPEEEWQNEVLHINQHQTVPLVDNYSIINPKGICLVQVPWKRKEVGRDYSNDPEIAKIIMNQKKGLVVSEKALLPDQNVPSIAFNYGFFTDGRLRVIVRAVIKMDVFSDKFLKKLPGYDFSIINSSGLIIADTHPSHMNQQAVEVYPLADLTSITKPLIYNGLSLDLIMLPRMVEINNTLLLIHVGMLLLFGVIGVISVTGFEFYRQKKLLKKDLIIRKKIEKRLRESEKKYMTLFDNSADAVFIMTLTGDILESNDVACAKFGFSKQEFKQLNVKELGLNIKEAEHPQRREGDKKSGQKVIERVLFSKSKQEIATEIRCRPMDYEGVSAKIAIIRDITERKSAEAKIREQNDAINKILESLTHPLYVINVEDFKVVLANKAAGLDLNSSNTTCHYLTHHSDKPCMQKEHPCPLALIKKTKKAVRVEHTHFDKEGKQRIVEVHGFPILDDHGNVFQMIEYTIDITDRRMAEAALMESETMFRSLIEQSKDAIYLVYMGKFIVINSKFETLFGYSIAECQNDSFDLRYIVSTESMHPFIEYAQRMESGHHSEPILEFTAISKHGRFIQCEISLSNIEYKNKTASLGIIRDVSERDRVLKEKNELEEQLNRNQRLETIGTLTGGIAHDFNNILMPIIGFSELAMLDLSPENPIIEYISEIQIAAHRAKELISQMLHFSRGSEQERKPILLQPIITEVIKLIRPTIPATISISEHIHPDCGYVLADEIKMHQVIINLCTNAYHAMEKNVGTLIISLEQVTITSTGSKNYPTLDEGSYNKISIEDTGHGMDMATQERIFDPFFTTKDVGKGTGLGLAVVLGIVKSFGGAISVESVPSHGSKFEVLLPEIANEYEEGKQKNKLNIKKGENQSILVIDDEEAILKMVGDILWRIGYQPKCINCHAKALQLIRMSKDQFDLVITDLTMPNSTGLELAKEIRRLNKTVPIIVLTGNSSLVSDKQLREIGIDLLLSKPVNMSQLASSVHLLLSQK